MRATLDAARALYRRDGAMVRDAAAVVLGVLLTVLALKTPWASSPWPVIAGTGLAGSAALWWRRRWPVAVTLVGIVALVGSGNPWPLAVGLCTTASLRRDRVLVAVTAAASVGFALPVLVDLGRLDLQTLATGAAEAIFVVAVGAYLGTRQDLLASLRDRAERRGRT